MKTLTSTAARRRFGALMKAGSRYLFVRKNGDKAIFISAQKYKQMRGITTVEPAKVGKRPTNSKVSSEPWSESN